MFMFRTLFAASLLACIAAPALAEPKGFNRSDPPELKYARGLEYYEFYCGSPPPYAPRFEELGYEEKIRIRAASTHDAVRYVKKMCPNQPNMTAASNNW